jgi:circadian clock protein KaiC
VNHPHPKLHIPDHETAPVGKRPRRRLSKAPTGIRGLDDITDGGLPRGRPTLVCGGAGCGKTLLAMEFLVRGATEFGEHGAFIAFEETSDELARNVSSLGYDVRSLMARNMLSIDHVEIDPDGEESGEFNLEGLFVRLKEALERVDAKRIVLDTIENLFSGFKNEMIVRAELRRLFRWLKDNHVTAIITGERGDGMLTRQGIEEYVSDCVILLDHRVTEQLATRRLRVVKYRGSEHGTDEYPFMIDNKGIVVVPVTSLLLNQLAPSTFVSTGVPQLDAMLGGRGYFSGSTVLVSGGAGTGKTSLGASFIERACRRGARAVYFAFEESMHQIIRSMNSIQLDLKKHVDRGLLRFHCDRPTLHGLETHLASMYNAVTEFDPKVVVIDPVTDLAAIGTKREVHAMLTRLIDFLKGRGLTAVMTGLNHDGEAVESTAVGISSLIDTWIELRGMEFGAERNRTLFIRKSRGMAHSNQVREFLITSQGLRLIDVCLGPEGVLTGSARVAHEMNQRAITAIRKRQFEAMRRQLQSRESVTKARIAALNAELEAEAYAIQASFKQESLDENSQIATRALLASLRSQSGNANSNRRGGKI